MIAILRTRDYFVYSRIFTFFVNIKKKCFNSFFRPFGSEKNCFQRSRISQNSECLSIIISTYRLLKWRYHLNHLRIVPLSLGLLQVLLRCCYATDPGFRSQKKLNTLNIFFFFQYLGSTVVKKVKGTESTIESIQKLKKTTSKELTSAPDITLVISYRGVKFLNIGTQSLICEHEIINIHCASQDADDLTHFAYITKDHISGSHYCHVFCVETMVSSSFFPLLCYQFIRKIVGGFKRLFEF